MHALMHDSMYKNAVLADFMMFKCNYCAESVIDILKVTKDEGLVKLFRNSLLSQFSLNSLGSALRTEPYRFGGKKYKSRGAMAKKRTKFGSRQSHSIIL
ncbi:hypothetical protein TSAR_010726 [Trichomalopsis sarcophagae]|uniref:Uncharacterized protein n=1 Tax=Trichomalopsis sarcophagae TaxID=543379 RepID=A0A232ENM3_9HYME|nr:hypothetical protein TSAR_010726 [Trichomalopsis sarcophagae]